MPRLTGLVNRQRLIHPILLPPDTHARAALTPDPSPGGRGERKFEPWSQRAVLEQPILEHDLLDIGRTQQHGIGRHQCAAASCGE